MRRIEKQNNSKEFFDHVFEKADYFCLALAPATNNDLYPYVLFLDFVHEGNIIYFHCANEGHKLDLIKANNHVAFTLAVDIEVDHEKATSRYKSICGTGVAHLVENIEEKRHVLQLFAKKFQTQCFRPGTSRLFERTQIVAIAIESMTGKQSPKPAAESRQ